MPPYNRPSSSTDTPYFTAAKKAGKVYEDLVAFAFASEYDSHDIAPDRKFSEYDIRWKKLMENALKITTGEIKADLRAYETGNICIEYETKNQPVSAGGSGITCSRADLWFQFIHNFDPNATEIEFFMIPTDKLREIISEYSLRTVWGGTDNASHMYLIPHKMADLQDYRYSVDLTQVPEDLLLRLRDIPKLKVSK